MTAALPSVVLRGSCASGDDGPWSDVDFVILPTTDELDGWTVEELLERAGARELAAGRLIDVIVVGPTELAINHLVRRAVQVGRLLLGPVPVIPDPDPRVWAEQARWAASWYAPQPDRWAFHAAVLWDACAQLVEGGWPVPARKATAPLGWPDDRWSSLVRAAATGGTVTADDWAAFQAR